MTIQDTIKQLCCDLREWVTNNLKVKVDKVDGKDLSDNNFTTAEKEKLENISESADAVSFTPALTTGTKVGTININGSDTDIYAPKVKAIYHEDEKVLEIL